MNDSQVRQQYMTQSLYMYMYICSVIIQSPGLLIDKLFTITLQYTVGYICPLTSVRMSLLGSSAAWPVNNSSITTPKAYTSVLDEGFELRKNSGAI